MPGRLMTKSELRGTDTDELRELCDRFNLSRSGTKDAVVNRLYGTVELEATSGEEGSSASEESSSGESSESEESGDEFYY